MAYDIIRTITAGPLTLPDVAACLGCCVRAGDDRHKSEAGGMAVELPAVLELIDAITRGDVTARQARAAFAPFLADVAAYDRECERRLADLDRD